MRRLLLIPAHSFRVLWLCIPPVYVLWLAAAVKAKVTKYRAWVSFCGWLGAVLVSLVILAFVGLVLGVFFNPSGTLAGLIAARRWPIVILSWVVGAIAFIVLGFAVILSSKLAKHWKQRLLYFWLSILWPYAPFGLQAMLQQKLTPVSPEAPSQPSLA